MNDFFLTTEPPRGTSAIFGYTDGFMSKPSIFQRAAEWLLCAWVIGTQLWYLAQFRPLVEFAARKVLHRG